ncbi:HAD family hydrolase [Aquamicrobium sp. LC103]|uniref:HAD family hydrolase n=1 Tax=Aquamicrobium sp. LC103 TaxID=1120658 RepID=UPI00063E878A|nr:HAD family hydrolase [Aquamicrobium sp. LC103]TKT82699.1 HAD family hydrolase [Aquamicrobium sp. LC103]
MEISRAPTVSRTGISPGLVIFDCDGVLVDSEPIAISVLCEVIAAAGHRLDEETAYRLFLGRSIATINELLARDFGLVFSPDDLEGSRQRLYDRFREELKPIAGIREAVAALSAARCVASSSQPERIRLSLEVTGLIDLFEPHIFSATMVARGKPAPDLFLHAAHEMGFAPRDCVVVEDSPAGIMAAKSAGMRVLAFAGGSHAAQGGLIAAFAELGPDLVFDDMRDLPALIAGATAP